MDATGNPSVVIPVHWDNFRVPYGFPQDEAIEKKIVPFSEEVKAHSPNSKFVVLTHLTPLVIKSADNKPKE